MLNASMQLLSQTGMKAIQRQEWNQRIRIASQRSRPMKLMQLVR